MLQFCLVLAHHQWKTLIQYTTWRRWMFRPARLPTTYCAPTTADQSVQFVLCCSCVKTACCPIIGGLTIWSILPQLPFHTFDTRVAPTWEHRHTHARTPSRSSSGALMWQAAVRVPYWCRQRVSRKHAWVNTLSCCCCCSCCCMSPQLHPFI